MSVDNHLMPSPRETTSLRMLSSLPCHELGHASPLKGRRSTGGWIDVRADIFSFPNDFPKSTVFCVTRKNKLNQTGHCCGSVRHGWRIPQNFEFIVVELASKAGFVSHNDDAQLR